MRTVLGLFALTTAHLVAADFAGSWAGATSNVQTPRPMYLTLEQAGQQVSGMIQFGSSGRATPIERGGVRGDSLTFEVREKNGDIDRFALAFVTIAGLPAASQVVLKGDATLGDERVAVVFYPVKEARAYSDHRSAAAPLVIYRVDPLYTAEARDSKVQGTVVLGVEVEPAGTISTDHVRVMRSLG